MRKSVSDALKSFPRIEPNPREAVRFRATRSRRYPMATTTQAAKSAVEQFTTVSNKAFKDSFDKSMSTLAELNTHSKKNFEAAVASVTAATKGVEALGAHAAAYSKKSVEDQVAAAKTI